MGQDTDFGQMECLKLITANTFIEKRIGYLGTVVNPRRPHPALPRTLRTANDGHQQNQDRPRQLGTTHLTQNNYIVALTLSVLSEICTAEMSKEIAPLIMTVRDF
jgi:AP-1 complex subunit gamma-1